MLPVKPILVVPEVNVYFSAATPTAALELAGKPVIFALGTKVHVKAFWATPLTPPATFKLLTKSRLKISSLHTFGDTFVPDKDGFGFILNGMVTWVPIQVKPVTGVMLGVRV